MTESNQGINRRQFVATSAPQALAAALVRDGVGGQAGVERCRAQQVGVDTYSSRRKGG